MTLQPVDDFFDEFFGEFCCCCLQDTLSRREGREVQEARGRSGNEAQPSKRARCNTGVRDDGDAFIRKRGRAKEEEQKVLKLRPQP